MVMEYEVQDPNSYFYMFLMTANVTLTFIVLLFYCVCCKRKVPKNELLGLEGMVKLKNPDEVIIVTTVVGKSESQADLNLSTVSNADSEKRTSTAAHRSLPDIPIAEANGDTGSELYETVADKRLLEAQGSQDKSPTRSLKKQISVSQHSSISQADDVSSPYSRVKNSPHDYAKVLSAEHPYAQLNAPSTSTAAAALANAGALNSNQIANDTVNRSSHHSGSMHDSNDGGSQVEIPAASAIAGMISASQDLPYMTPPIANQHFSGDSQDSSKGYTSISVREPLANILAQQPTKLAQRNPTLSRDVNDSHYATVSDDSDETYAAIEDPNIRNNPNLAMDIYTSGSETYAQIQPMQSVVVSVEINNTSAASGFHSSQHAQPNSSNISNVTTHTHWSSATVSDHAVPVPPPVDSLRAQMHSRQASSSSNNSSSVGNLGSPKPEKRQANSPLPPTPKTTNALPTTSSNNLASGRNSIISVIELTGANMVNDVHGSEQSNNSPLKKNKSLSPSKDIEGMYAKVIKKNKFSTRDSPPSQNNSPVMTRKYNNHSTITSVALGVSPLDTSTASILETHKISISTSDRNRSRCNSYGAKDHGYETIPADANRKSDCYTNILQKERLQLENNVPPIAANHPLNYMNSKPPIDSVSSMAAPYSSTSSTAINCITYQSDKHYETIAGPMNSSDPGYETLLKPKTQTDTDNEKKTSDYDPNYEVLKGPNNSAGLSDDGYAKVIEKKRLNVDEDSIDGYSKVKGEETEDGYSTIREFKEQTSEAAHHNYASISEAKAAAGDVHKSANGISESPIPESLSLSATSTPVNTISSAPIERRMRPNELPTILSPSSFNSSSLLNTSSAASSANLTTTSTMSTLSSRQTPSSSQYESLTGSDTDPNYESVSYVQTNRSNSGDLHPYERLNADYSDTQLSSPRTPPDAEQTTLSQSSSVTGAAVVLLNITATAPQHTSSSTIMPNTVRKSTTMETPADVVVVDDYFQV